MEQSFSPAGMAVIGAESLDDDWKVIGSGGSCQVYKARHLQWRRDVAVKILCRDDGSSSEEDLAREAKLMLSAECPYIMRVLGVYKGRTPYSPFIYLGLVMDLMEGGSLYSLQKKRGCQLLPWPLVFRLAHEVALGMNYLHSLTPHAIVHKDLKPQNVLLDSNLTVKITDFGISKFADSVTAVPVKGMCTTFFAPPEALKVRATPAYDVYSYAILLWTILNPAYNEAWFDVSNGERPSLEDVKKMEAPGLEELVELMVRCWNQDPDQRPTFAECTAVTEGLYEKNKGRIRDAVHRVQLELDGVPQPAVPQPDVPKPDVPKPDVPQPDVPNPYAQEFVDMIKAALAAAAASSPVAAASSPVAAASSPVSAVSSPVGAANREDLLQYVCELTLDPNTAHGLLSLSENNRKVEVVKEDQDYPPHEDRFMTYAQVMCKDPLTVTGRSYFEIECSGHFKVAVARRGIKKKGKDSRFGYNKLSWCLDCNQYGRMYSVMHKKKNTDLNISFSSSTSIKVAVYVDMAAGTVSFYDVSYFGVLTHLHTFQSTFTEPLYVGFRGCRYAYQKNGATHSLSV